MQASLNEIGLCRFANTIVQSYVMLCQADDARNDVCLKERLFWSGGSDVAAGICSLKLKMFLFLGRKASFENVVLYFVMLLFF